MSRNELFECEVFFICLMPWVFVCTFFIHNRITASALISSLPLRRTHTLFTLGWMHSNEIGLIVARRSSSVGNVKLFYYVCNTRKRRNPLKRLKLFLLSIHELTRSVTAQPAGAWNIPLDVLIQSTLRINALLWRTWFVFRSAKPATYVQSNCHLSTISCHRRFIY